MLLVLFLFFADTELQKYILREHYIVTLALQLFGKKDHCRSCDFKSAIDAFLVIAKRGKCVTMLLFLPAQLRS